MQEGVPWCRSKMTMDYLKSEKVTVLDWPGNFPELNHEKSVACRQETINECHVEVRGGDLKGHGQLLFERNRKVDAQTSARGRLEKGK